MKKNVLFILICSLFAITVTAQTVHNLNSQSMQGTGSDAANAIVPQEFLKEAKSSRAFVINPALQSASSVERGDIVNLELFEGKSYMATVSRTNTDANGTFSISLKLPDYPLAYGYVSTSKNKQSLFFISIPELNQTFTSRVTANTQTDYLMEIDDNSILKLNNDERDIPVLKIESDGREGSELSDAAQICSRDVNLKDTDPATIRVLVVYTPAAKNWAGPGDAIDNVINGAMNIAQNVLDNQGNGDRIVLAHSAQVNYTETPNSSMNNDLDYLTNDLDGVMDEVHQLRKQYEADIVSLFVVNNALGGLGWVLMNDAKGSYQYAFNVIRVQQAAQSTTLIHEIGHNMAMRHEIEQYPTPPTPLYPYAWGYYWTGSDSKVYGSVMSYTGIGTQFFSNPDQIYMGGATGTSSANNAQVFRNTKHVVAFYKEILKNLPDAPTNIIVSNPTNNGATFNWDACAGATSYSFNLKTSANSWTSWIASSPPYTLNRSDRFDPCTSYEVWISALNSCGDEIRSQLITFTTKCATDPTVTTSAATGITSNSATLNKTVTANGGEAVTQQGFMYKETTATTWQTSVNGNLTGLTPETEYKFYAYAVTAQGTFNSVVQTFKTAAVLPAQTPGDINGDGNVNLVDYAYFSRQLAGWPGYGTSTTVGDVNGDGVVNLIDLAYLSRYLAGWAGYTKLGP